jgi:hypothetical protein
MSSPSICAIILEHDDDRFGLRKVSLGRPLLAGSCPSLVAAILSLTLIRVLSTTLLIIHGNDMTVFVAD